MIPSSVTVIGWESFRGCTSLQSIEIPDSAKEIGFEAFRDCTSLQSIVIPGSGTKIGWEAFRDCPSLQSIVVNGNRVSIEQDAFSGCKSLKSITISTISKEPHNTLMNVNIKRLLNSISKDLDQLEIVLRVPIGCGYVYRHHPAFEGKFKTIIADIDD